MPTLPPRDLIVHQAFEIGQKHIDGPIDEDGFLELSGIEHMQIVEPLVAVEAACVARRTICDQSARPHVGSGEAAVDDHHEATL